MSPSFLNDDPKAGAREILILSAGYLNDLLSTDGGMLVSMRERATHYYEKQLKREQEDLDYYSKMPLAEFKDLAEKEYQRELNIYKEKIAYANAQLQHLEKVKKEVDAWVPPSEKHKEIKDIALEKLETAMTVERTILHTSLPSPVEPEEYLRRLLTGIEASIAFYKERIMNTKTQNTQTSSWVSTLMQSLDETYGKPKEGLQ
jgi:hypothetical protein